MKVSSIRGDALAAMPWKNGGGITREVAMRANAWRASIADIDRDGPFSRFDGVDRVLVLLDGAGLMLNENIVLDVARFDGESAMDARLTRGPVRVFNVMTHRGAARASIDLCRDGDMRTVDASTVLLHCVHGALRVRFGGEHETLTTMDTLVIDDARGIEIATQGEGALLCISLDTEGQS